MNLLPPDIAQSIPKLYEQESKGEDAVIHVKLFDPCSNWTWYMTELDGQDVCFGLVKGLETELGYFSSRDLQQYKGRLRIGIERDIWFKPCSLKDIRQRLE